MDYTTELWYFLIKCNKCTLTHIFLILRQLCICCQFISNPHNFHDARCANPADHAASCTTFALCNTKNIFSIKKVVQNEMVSSCFAQHTACRFHLLRYKLCKTLISILPLHNHHCQKLCRNGFYHIHMHNSVAYILLPPTIHLYRLANKRRRACASGFIDICRKFRVCGIHRAKPC